MMADAADSNQSGKINFSGYLLLFQLLTTPESEFEIAFRIFDPQNTGLITKEAFKKVIQSNEHVALPDNFDFDCDLMKTFFGKNGSSSLSFVQFSQFMTSLQEEIRKQEFQNLSAPDGTISAEQFSKLILSNVSQHDISDKIYKNIQKIGETSTERISYAEFDGYNKVLRNIETISQSIRVAAQKSKDGCITKAAFSLAAKRVTGIGLSPMEVRIIFKTFSSDEEQEKLLPEDYEAFINIASDETNRRSKVINLWLKDEIAEDGISQATSYELFMAKLKKFSLKTLYGGAAGAVGATLVYPIVTFFFL
jgi:solute carrier family 25 (mitochondrial aspartate/glutamate transporter), member 12/13